VVVCLLLTSLVRAEANRHFVHALVRDGASTNNGIASTSPSAPNSVMQAQAMTQAWNRAGVEPAEIGFIEGHGSGTLLGDSLEIEAYRLAFAGRAAGALPCALSSVKANIGHGRSAAGLSSVVKAVLSVQRGVLFPMPHVRQLNAVLKKPDSPVYVNADLLPWHDDRRIAAVHSVGMSGSNGHVVVENYRATQPAECPGEWFPVPVSSRSDRGLAENVAAISAWIAANESAAFPDIARTLCLGRDHCRHRLVVLARDTGTLRRRWDEWLTACGAEPVEPVGSVPRVLLALSSERADAEAIEVLSEQVAERFPRFGRAFERLCALQAGDAALITAFQLALYELLQAMGISGSLMGVGIGKGAAAAIRGTIAAADAVREAESAADDRLTDLTARVSRFVAGQLEQGPVVFVQMGPDSRVSREIRRCVGGASAARVEAFGDDGVESIGQLFERLFAEGCSLQFGPWFEERRGRPVALPGYRFARTRCWIRDTPRPSAAAAHGTGRAPTASWDERWGQARPVEWKIGEIVRELLAHDGFGPDDNLFDLGADSLMATRIIRRINEEFDVRCDFEDVFDRPTAAGIADLVRARCSVTSVLRAIWRDVLKVDALGDDDDFFDLGGHSLLASEILIRVNREFGVMFSFDDFFRVPTVSAFERVLNERRHALPAGSAIPDTPPATSCVAPPLTLDTWAAALRRRETL
jgi:acyl carrier protein